MNATAKPTSEIPQLPWRKQETTLRLTIDLDWMWKLSRGTLLKQGLLSALSLVCFILLFGMNGGLFEILTSTLMGLFLAFLLISSVIGFKCALSKEPQALTIEDED